MYDGNVKQVILFIAYLNFERLTIRRKRGGAENRKHSYLQMREVLNLIKKIDYESYRAFMGAFISSAKL